MAWKTVGKRRYYYRTKRIDGRVVTEYVGCGSKGKKGEAADERRRGQRERRCASVRAKKADYSERLATAMHAIDAFQRLMNAALVASGFYRNDNSAWRTRYGTTRRRQT